MSEYTPPIVSEPVVPVDLPEHPPAPEPPDPPDGGEGGETEPAP